MAAFSASDIAFEGFRITRERPGWLLAWGGLLFAVQLVTLLVLAGLAGSAFTELQAASTGAQPDPAAMMAAYSRMAPAYSVIWPLALLASTVLTCAVYRAVLRPQEPSLLGMRVGGDELRVLVVSIAVGLLLAVVVFVGVILAALVGGGVGAFAGEGAGVAVGLVVGLAVLGVAVFGGVRLSFALPMTFDHKDFRVFESWRATAGMFWPLLGAYLLAFLLGMLVSLLVLIVLVAVGAGLLLAFGQQLQGAFATMSDPAALMQAALPVLIVYALGNAVLQAVFNTILLAPPAAAWRQMSGPEKVFV